MATQIEELKELQRLDLTISGLRENIDARPRKIGVRQGVVKDSAAQIEAKKLEIQDCQKALDERDVDLKDGEEKLKRLKMLLNAAKTNDEYSLLNRSIADQERKNSQAEEQILEAMARGDELKAEREKLEEQHGKSEETLRSAEEEAARDTISLKGTLEERLSERVELTDKIADEALKQYERIFVLRRDGALAKVDENVCQGCFMSIPNQWVSLLHINRDMVTCPSCGRILFL
ncbi:MAG: C4-type zinc ribbon domain-containing protein [Planctomycetota bacterium]|nr:C4-type zinc ribbon domain-containing protein [Planctomycetota bacterium]